MVVVGTVIEGVNSLISGKNGFNNSFSSFLLSNSFFLGFPVFGFVGLIIGLCGLVAIYLGVVVVVVVSKGRWISERDNNYFNIVFIDFIILLSKINIVVNTSVIIESVKQI